MAAYSPGKQEKAHDAQSAPVIQTWPAREAPEGLRRLVDQCAGYEWITLVPSELNAPDVLQLLLRNEQSEAVQIRELNDGGVLLAGHFNSSSPRPSFPLQTQPGIGHKSRSTDR